jgi:hypothetical protein
MKPVKAGRLFGSLLAAIAVIVAVVAPVAQADTPAPGFERFAGCPGPSENPNIVACVTSTITGGHFQMGSKTVPLSKPMTLSGGIEPSGNLHANSKGGLPPVKQQVPGGVIGITGLDWLVNFLSLEGLKLYAVTEIAGVPNVGEVLTLPIKVRLVNPVLGNNCYVGSYANPIVLKLTTATTSPPPPNQPITGKNFEYTFNEELVTGKNGEMVDNSFAAPGASGCTLTLFGFIPISINGLVNSQSGLPSPAGTNETRQLVDQELAPVHKVYP